MPLQSNILQFSRAGLLQVLLMISVPVIVLLTSYLIASGYSLSVVYAVAALAGILLITLCIIYPLHCFYLAVILSFFIVLPNLITGKSIPVTTGIEVILFVILISSSWVYNNQGKRFWTSPATIGLALYFVYIVIQLFNPEMFSTKGWLFYTRRVLMFIFIYMITYRLLSTEERIKTFLKVWYAMVILTALYGCYQQFFGLLPFEINALKRNPLAYGLYFQGGSMRKFSILSDPTQFGILCGTSSVFFFIMALNLSGRNRKLWCWLAFIICILGMSFSGTRTAIVILPACVFLYGLLTITRKSTLLAMGAVAIALMTIFIMPTNNRVVYRIKSTFNPADASLRVRDINRHYIQPYIYKHPIGGGVLTSGVQGEKYNSGHALAGFPPDSGLLQAAMELGWIGYALTLLVYFLMLYQGVHFFFLFNWRQHPKIKLLLAALTCTIFGLVITQYAQITIGQFPSAFFFYSALAIMIRLREMGEASYKTNNSVPLENKLRKL